MNPQEPIRIAVVGTNFISDWFVHACGAVAGVRVAAVFSRKRETGNAFADRHGIGEIFTDFSALLRAQEIDALYIASPIACHAEQSIAALRAGKHVLCEKMIGATASEFFAMKNAADQSGKVLLEAMRPAFDPALAAIRGQLPRLGKIRCAALSFCQYSSRYDAFLAGEVMNAFDPSLKNSALADIGIYPLFLCVALFGEPTDVAAAQVTLSNGFAGAGTALLSYPDMTATIRYSKIHDDILPSTIEGENGALLIDKISAPSRLEFCAKGGGKEEISLPPAPSLPSFTAPNGKIGAKHMASSHANMVYEIAAFRDAVRGKIDPAPYLATTAAVMRTVDRIQNA